MRKPNMFCPKCGSQNTDEAKFCRGCGADVSNVLAVVEGRGMAPPASAKQRVTLLSAGLRGTIIAAGLVTVAIVAYGISPRLAVLTIFSLIAATIFFGIGVSRLVQARGLRQLKSENTSEPPPALPQGEADYITPSRSPFQTDDLSTLPGSVTDHTTRHLK